MDIGTTLSLSLSLARARALSLSLPFYYGSLSLPHTLSVSLFLIGFSNDCFLCLSHFVYVYAYMYVCMSACGLRSVLVSVILSSFPSLSQCLFLFLSLSVLFSPFWFLSCLSLYLFSCLCLCLCHCLSLFLPLFLTTPSSAAHAAHMVPQAISHGTKRLPPPTAKKTSPSDRVGIPRFWSNPHRASARLGSIIVQGDQSGAIGVEGSGDQGLGFWVRVKGGSSIYVQPNRVLTVRSEGRRWRSCSTNKRTERLKKKKRKSLGNSRFFINSVIPRFFFQSRCWTV